MKLFGKGCSMQFRSFIQGWSLLFTVLNMTCDAMMNVVYMVYKQIQSSHLNLEL